MRMTLEEQEQTQVEQDKVLEAKLEEAESLATGKTRLPKYLKACTSIFLFSWISFKVVFIIIHSEKVFVFLECPVTCHLPM